MGCFYGNIGKDFSKDTLVLFSDIAERGGSHGKLSSGFCILVFDWYELIDYVYGQRSLGDCDYNIDISLLSSNIYERFEVGFYAS